MWWTSRNVEDPGGPPPASSGHPEEPGGPPPVHNNDALSNLSP